MTPTSMTPVRVAPRGLSGIAADEAGSPPLDPVTAAWHPVARFDELDTSEDRRAIGVRLLGHELVVMATADGGAAVLPGRCPHRGTALAGGRVIDDTVTCPYHGWRFDGSGSCTAIPSLPDGPIPPGAHIGALATVVRHGLVWTSLAVEPDPSEIPWFPTIDDTASGPSDGMRVVEGAPMTWRTSAGRHLENILDLGHFPFVHPATFGCKEAETVAPHDVVADERGISASVQVTTRNPDTPIGPLYTDLGPLIALGYHYRVDLPYRITLRFDFPDGMRRALHEVITPVAPDECRIYWALLVDPRLDSSDDDERVFAHAVFAEDQPVIESQPPGVPVSARAEVHLPSDRLAVAYRRALRTAGMPDHALV